MLHKRIDAMDCLISSVRAFPYNWSAWKELSRTLNLKNAEREQILDLLPASFMSVFFLEYTQRQSTQIDDGHFERIDALLSHFPGSAYLLTCRAQSLYLLSDSLKLSLLLSQSQMSEARDQEAKYLLDQTKAHMHSCSELLSQHWLSGAISQSGPDPVQSGQAPTLDTS